MPSSRSPMQWQPPPAEPYRKPIPPKKALAVAVLFVTTAGVLGAIDATVSTFGFGLVVILLACIPMGAQMPTLGTLVAAALSPLAYGFVHGLIARPAGLVTLAEVSLGYTCVGVFCFLLTGLFAILGLDRRPWPPPEADRCTECEYLLIGLTEPRCPECGTPFEVDKLKPLESTRNSIDS